MRGDPYIAFVRAAWAEAQKNRNHPTRGDQGSLVTALALAEEAGEAIKALNHILEGKGGEAELYLECVQTAAMALRLATELEDRSTWAGNVPAVSIPDEAARAVGDAPGETLNTLAEICTAIIVPSDDSEDRRRAYRLCGCNECLRKLNSATLLKPKDSAIMEDYYPGGFPPWGGELVDRPPRGHFAYEVGSGGPVCQCAWCGGGGS